METEIKQTGRTLKERPTLIKSLLRGTASLGIGIVSSGFIYESWVQKLQPCDFITPILIGVNTVGVGFIGSAAFVYSVTEFIDAYRVAKENTAEVLRKVF